LQPTDHEKETLMFDIKLMIFRSFENEIILQKKEILFYFNKIMIRFSSFTINMFNQGNSMSETEQQTELSFAIQR